MSSQSAPAPSRAEQPARSRHDRTTAELSHVEIVEHLFHEGWGAHPGWEETWRGCMSADFKSFFHSLPPVEGIKEAIDFNRQLFVGFPDLEVDVQEIIVEGNNVVVRSRLTGSHKGTFLGVPETGASVNVADVTVYKFANGKVVEKRYFTDLLAVMSAIGAVPSMG